MAEEGSFGVFFCHKGKLSRDQIKEVQNYFSRYGEIKSVVGNKYGRVYVNYKFASDANKCVEDSDNSKYGNVRRAQSSSASDTSSVHSHEAKGTTVGKFGCSPPSQLTAVKSKTTNTKKTNAVSYKPSLAVAAGCHPTDMPPLVPARSFLNESPAGMPPLVPARQLVTKPNTGAFLKGIQILPALLALEAKYACQVIVGNLSELSTIEEVCEIFESLHPIYVSPIRPTNVRKKFLYCCLKFLSEKEARSAVGEHHGSILHGNYLHVIKLDEIRAECRQLKMRHSGNFL